MKKINLSPETIKQIKDILVKYTTYKAFSKNKEDAYRFTALVGVKICPYCNINYVYTVFDEGGNPVVRPDIDHFVPQSSRPTLALKWSNLVPSCNQCNSRLKLSTVFKRATHLHPYYDDFDSIFKFAIYISSTNYMKESNITIALVPVDKSPSYAKRKAKRNIKKFRLEERYQYHKNEVLRIFSMLKFYHKYKRTELSELLGQKNIMDSILISEENCNINNTSLGKLKRDIIREYK